MIIETPMVHPAMTDTDSENNKKWLDNLHEWIAKHCEGPVNIKICYSSAEDRIEKIVKTINTDNSIYQINFEISVSLFVELTFVLLTDEILFKLGYN